MLNVDIVYLVYLTAFTKYGVIKVPNMTNQIKGWESMTLVFNIHSKKRLAIFPSPAGMSLTKLSLAGNNWVIPGQGEFGQWHPVRGQENRYPFLQCNGSMQREPLVITAERTSFRRRKLQKIPFYLPKIDSVKTLTDKKNLFCERNQSGIYLYFLVCIVFWICNYVVLNDNAKKLKIH